ncbi:MAG: hypothetical protein ACT4QG_12215 [Sporichthyaceae bacterium]
MNVVRPALLAAAGALVAVPLAPMPALAESSVPDTATAVTSCTISALEVAFRPGLGLKPSRGSFFGKGGKVACDGPVLGRKVTGPGLYTSAGRIGTTDPDSCTSGGEGWGVLTIVFPTDRGKFTVRNPISFTYGALTKKGLLKGEFEGDFFDGVFNVFPKKGDCVTAPLTVSTVTADIEFHDFRTSR